jgi:hypothetical protein
VTAVKVTARFRRWSVSMAAAEKPTPNPRPKGLELTLMSSAKQLKQSLIKQVGRCFHSCNRRRDWSEKAAARAVCPNHPTIIALRAGRVAHAPSARYHRARAHACPRPP